MSFFQKKKINKLCLLKREVKIHVVQMIENSRNNKWCLTKFGFGDNLGLRHIF